MKLSIIEKMVATYLEKGELEFNSFFEENSDEFTDCFTAEFKDITKVIIGMKSETDKYLGRNNYNSKQLFGLVESYLKGEKCDDSVLERVYNLGDRRVTTFCPEYAVKETKKDTSAEGSFLDFLETLKNLGDSIKPKKED